MQPPRIIRIVSKKASALWCAALILAVVSPCQGKTAGKGENEEALRADARETFQKKVEPFVKTYCTKCHGGGRAKANVKVHDMPPIEDARKFPTAEERRQFEEWVGKLKYLAPRNPGPYVIRRLTPVDYGNTLRDLYGVDPSIAETHSFGETARKRHTAPVGNELRRIRDHQRRAADHLRRQRDKRTLETRE